MSNSSERSGRWRGERPALAAATGARAAAAPLLGSALGRRLLLLTLASAALPLGALAAIDLLLPEAPRHWLYAAAALSISAAMTIGAIQARTVVAHLRQLLTATRRLAVNDFAGRLPVQGRDELAELTEAFNEMSHGLGMNFAAMTALSQIDKAILARLDPTEVVRYALKCVRYVSPADVAALALFDGEGSEWMKVFVERSDGRPRIRLRVQAAADLNQRLAATLGGRWTDEPPLPDSIIEVLEKEDRAIRYWVRPIARAGRVWGALMLAHHSDLALSVDQLAMLSGINDRLEVAFASIERDRKLQTMAHADPLTGLPNRHAMLGLMTQELANAQRDGSKAAILFLDLDRFKRTNDTLGHAIGDAVLQEAAERIKSKLRSSDIVARPGGDEFTVVLGKLATERDAGHIARELIKALSRPFEIASHTIYVGASVGIALYPQDGDDGADLLKKADSAMYRAKDQGRNRFAYYEESMNVEAQRRATLDRELRQAFARSELLLHYQPQIDLRSGRVCAVEALIRWQHPQKGLLYPASFIPFAEESGLIDAIGSWVLKEACLQHQRWRLAQVPIPCVSVNVSNRQLLRSNFLRNMLYLLDLAKMPVGSLEIEVTESTFMDGGKAGISVLNSLVEHGVRVAIDDFGTGYSSFGYLKTLPAEILKLDKSFLIDAPGDSDAETIIAAMINMAHTLRKEVVAEGVERADQQAFLERLGCEKAQGFLFTRALDADSVAGYASDRLRRFPPAQAEPAPLQAESV